jgi:rubrerythrin
MDWNSPYGILRRAMQIERDGYKFYNEVAERAIGERGRNMFRGLAADEEKHLRLLLIEYKALESGQGWIDPTQALDQDLDLDPANPDLPGEEYPEPSPIFTPAREPSLEGDIAALEFGMETEELSYNLYKKSAEGQTDPAAKQAYELLAEEENRHYEILQSSHDYLVDNETWWDSEEFPFFEG